MLRLNPGYAHYRTKSHPSPWWRVLVFLASLTRPCRHLLAGDLLLGPQWLLPRSLAYLSAWSFHIWTLLHPSGYVWRQRYAWFLSPFCTRRSLKRWVKACPCRHPHSSGGVFSSPGSSPGAQQVSLALCLAPCMEFFDCSLGDPFSKTLQRQYCNTVTITTPPPQPRPKESFLL